MIWKQWYKNLQPRHDWNPSYLMLAINAWDIVHHHTELHIHHTDQKDHSARLLDQTFWTKYSGIVVLVKTECTFCCPSSAILYGLDMEYLPRQRQFLFLSWILNLTTGVPKAKQYWDCLIAVQLNIHNMHIKGTGQAQGSQETAFSTKNPFPIHHRLITFTHLKWHFTIHQFNMIKSLFPSWDDYLPASECTGLPKSWFLPLVLLFYHWQQLSYSWWLEQRDVRRCHSSE